MLFSASYSTGYYRFKGDIYHFIRPQVILAVVGLVLMYLISNINYRQPAPHELVLIHFNAAAFGVGPVQ